MFTRMCHRVYIIPAIRGKRHGIRWHNLAQRPGIWNSCECDALTSAAPAGKRGKKHSPFERDQSQSQWESICFILLLGFIIFEESSVRDLSSTILISSQNWFFEISLFLLLDLLNFKIWIYEANRQIVDIWKYFVFL